MANKQSAIKRIRQNEKRRLRNRHYRGGARTFINNAREAIESGNLENAREATQIAVKALDKAAQKGVLPRDWAVGEDVRELELE